jgi:hypothetical protein
VPPVDGLGQVMVIGEFERCMSMINELLFFHRVVN